MKKLRCLELGRSRKVLFAVLIVSAQLSLSLIVSESEGCFLRRRRQTRCCARTCCQSSPRKSAHCTPPIDPIDGATSISDLPEPGPTPEIAEFKAPKSVEEINKANPYTAPPTDELPPLVDPTADVPANVGANATTGN